MSKQAPETTLQNVKVDVLNVRRHTYGPYLQHPQNVPPERSGAKYSTKSDFVYVNNAYVGSVDNVNANRLYERPTT